MPSSSSSSASASSSRTASRTNSRQSVPHYQQEQQHSVFEEEEDEDDENGGTTIRIRLVSSDDLTSRHVRGYEQDSEYENDTSFEPCYPLTPLEINYKPLHRIKRNGLLRRALSDSCTSTALSSDIKTKTSNSVMDQHLHAAKGRKVSFCDSVQVVDVFAAIDYPAR